ncbi:hypothetical protein D9M72_286900 [compost metagenome]
MVPAHAFRRGDKDFKRRVAGPRAHASQAGIDAVAALFHGDHGVGYAEAQVVVGVHTGVRGGIEHVLERTEALAHAVHGECAAGVNDVDAGGAIAFHQLRLLRQHLGRGHVAHHQEADRVHAKLAGVLDMLARDVGFGAMRGHAHDAGAGVIGGTQVVDGADAWQQQCGHLGMRNGFRHGCDPFQVGMRAESVVER